MHLQVSIDEYSSPAVLEALSAFVLNLSKIERNQPPAEPKTAPAPETAPVEQKQTRRRRTKAEIEADEAAAAGTADSAAGPFYWSHPESESFGIEETRAGLEKVLAGDIAVVEVSEEDYKKLVEAAEAAEAQASNKASKTTEKSGVKVFSQSEVQHLAGSVARAASADVVKAEIAKYKVGRIAELNQDQLNLMGAFLTGYLESVDL